MTWSRSESEEAAERDAAATKRRVLASETATCDERFAGEVISMVGAWLSLETPKGSLAASAAGENATNTTKETNGECGDPQWVSKVASSCGWSTHVLFTAHFPLFSTFGSVFYPVIMGSSEVDVDLKPLKRRVLGQPSRPAVAPCSIEGVAADGTLLFSRSAPRPVGQSGESLGSMATAEFKNPKSPVTAACETSHRPVCSSV